MGTLTYRMAAKTDVGRVRTNNEDNFQVADNLSEGKMSWANNQVCTLGDKGALLVVADGMGGMNAGEVASEIAINTIRSYFAPEHLTPEVMNSDAAMEAFMNQAVVVADNNIKNEAKTRPETKGMGTTIVIGWLYRKHLYVSWCGDSRAYVFNPQNGLHQLSKDHSYVQDLVDAGKLNPEDAFDYPESNIITRCLSDSITKARPDNLTKPYEVCDGDIIMLCTDGLCGLLRDYEMSRILSAYTDDMDAAVAALIEGACNAGGHDNVTVCLCQILSGGAVAAEAPQTISIQSTSSISNTPVQHPDTTKKHNHVPLVIVIIIAMLLLIGGGVYVGAKRFGKETTEYCQGGNDSGVAVTGEGDSEGDNGEKPFGVFEKNPDIQVVDSGKSRENVKGDTPAKGGESAGGKNPTEYRSGSLVPYHPQGISGLDTLKGNPPAR